MSNNFQRLELLIEKENLELLNKTTVLVIGIGGVGGYVVESLARTNIGKIILVDYDLVDTTNINRQIIALNSTVGAKKTDLFKDRIKDINPNCKVVVYDMFLNKDNINEVFTEKIDYVVDCCDTVSTKYEIIRKCLEKNIKIVSSMGTGNKIDVTKLEIVDIKNTINDPLARIIRKFVKEEFTNKKLTVLSSKELPKKIKSKTIASISFVPATAGLLIASFIIKDIIKL